MLGQGRWYGVYASGRLGASGTKSFEIDHPLDPENKKLKHYTIESPEVLNLYRGNAIMDNNGEAVITLPEYFLAINIDFSYVLTPIGQQAPVFIKQEIDDDGKFVIAGGNPEQKISWVVYAKRNDRFMQRERKNEPDLVEVEKKEFEKGKYIQPELYNQPPEKGIFYIKHSGQQTKDQKNKVNRGGVRTFKNTGQRTQKVNETKVVEKEKK